MSENRFGSNENITREQIAAIIHRYAKHKGYEEYVGEDTNIYLCKSVFGFISYV